MSTKAISPADLAMVLYTVEILNDSLPHNITENAFREQARILFTNLPHPESDPSDARIKAFAENIADLAIETKDLVLSQDLLLLVKTIQSAFKKIWTPVPARNRSAIEKIEHHNKMAYDALSRSCEEAPLYPYSKQDKIQAKKERKLLSTFSFSPSSEAQIYAKTVSLAKSKVKICAAQGRRTMMEDRFIAQTLSFSAYGIVYLADLFGVFDGHDGKEVVDYVAQNLPGELKKLFSKMGYSRKEVPARLKEAVANLHQAVLEKELKGGTTAVFGFKMEGSNDLFIANIGDSTAFIHRNGETIPLSIPQKPQLLPTKKIAVPDLIPNRYARQLLDNGVKLNLLRNAELEEQTLERQKMVLSPLPSPKDGSLPLLLGVPNRLHMDMARSIGDAAFSRWTKHTPEIFGTQIQPGDQLILHSDGIEMTQLTLVNILSRDKKQGCSTGETLQCLVQASIPSRDNVCAMSVTFQI